MKWTHPLLNRVNESGDQKTNKDNKRNKNE
jgi:hypothetical protein